MSYHLKLQVQGGENPAGSIRHGLFLVADILQYFLFTLSNVFQRNFWGVGVLLFIASFFIGIVEKQVCKEIYHW